MQLAIMQGDQYALPVEIRDREGTPLSADTVEEVEIVIGALRKTLSSGVIFYSQKEHLFFFPLTQKESFAMTGRAQRVQIRVKLSGSGDVIGEDLGDLQITPSLSKEVLA